MKIVNLTLILSFTLLVLSCSKDSPLIEDLNHYDAPESKSIEIEALELINAYRIDNGLPILSNNVSIKGQAYSHSEYMVSHSNLSHDNFYKRSAYLTNSEGALAVGENVAYGYTKANSLVKAWIRSDKHRKNILGDYTHFEISAEQDSEGMWYYTNIFMKK